jgi:hypothetical protein
MRACSHERLGASFLNHVSVLIENSPVPGDDASASFGLWFERHYGRDGVNRITEDDGQMELPLENGQEREGVDPRRLADQASRDGQTEQPMRDRFSEVIALSERMVDMQRIEVAGKTSEEDDIGFSHGPSGTFPFVTDDEVIERTG